VGNIEACFTCMYIKYSDVNTARFFQRCPEQSQQVSRLSRRMQAFYAIKLPCSGRRNTKTLCVTLRITRVLSSSIISYPKRKDSVLGRGFDLENVRYFENEVKEEFHKPLPSLDFTSFFCIIP
jgi:hypothetical protein